MSNLPRSLIGRQDKKLIDQSPNGLSRNGEARGPEGHNVQVALEQLVGLLMGKGLRSVVQFTIVDDGNAKFVTILSSVGPIAIPFHMTPDQARANAAMIVALADQVDSIESHPILVPDPAPTVEQEGPAIACNEAPTPGST